MWASAGIPKRDLTPSIAQIAPLHNACTMTQHAITFQISESDYLDAQRLFRRSASKWARALVGLIVLFGVAVVAAGLYAGKAWLIFLGLVYATLPWWLQVLVNNPLSRRHFRKYPAIHGPQSLSLLTQADAPDGAVQGVTMRSTLGETHLTWPLIHRWAENDQFLLLYLQPRMYFIVPKRADPGDQVLRPLREQLRQHVPAAGRAAR